VIDSIEQNGRQIYKADDNAANWIGSADRAAFFQLKSILQGVLLRGTARSARHLATYAAGKTGTTDDELDAWFVGFTNDVTVALWVGYDNAEGTRRTLGPGQTGGRVALPMFEPILDAVWRTHAPKTALRGPSKEALRQLVAVQVDPYTGEMNQYGHQYGNQYSGQYGNQYGGDRYGGQQRTGGSVEYLRRDSVGQITDTRYKIVSRGDNYSMYRGADGYEEDGSRVQRWPYDSQFGFRDFFQQFQPRQQPPQSGYYSGGYYYGQRPQQQPQQQQRAPQYYGDEYRPQAPRRVDPDYFFGRRQQY
jgi:membrane peptidoglycan carboxypeptidase